MTLPVVLCRQSLSDNAARSTGHGNELIVTILPERAIAIGE